MPILHIRLLGEFNLSYDSEPVSEIKTARLQSLLAHLVLHRDAPQLRQRLAFTFWSDTSESQARTNLRNLIHLLRQALPDADTFLCVDSTTIQWRPSSPFTLDVAEFENAVACSTLEKAIELYGGDLMPSCYDDWIITERERLQQIYVQTLDQLIHQTEEQQDHCKAIEYAQRLLRHDPLREETYRSLMRQYALNGDRVGIVRTYDTCITVLQRELSIEPSSETRAEYARCLNAPSSPKKSKSLHVDVALNNLPLLLTQFIGRADEKNEVEKLILDHRLVTLTGTGGVGKTRLAIEVVGDLAKANRYKNGTWWIDLAPLSDGNLLPHAIAVVFNLHESPGMPMTSILANYFRAKELLLVLDNCEHLIDACAPLVETLMTQCSGLQVLVTSREPLGIAGEIIWRVPSLSLPNAQICDLPIEELAQYDAIRLFSDRAEKIVSNWRLGDHARATTDLCLRLDGIPLAIELATARLNVLSTEQIVARLEDRFHLLTSGSRTALPRHQTLRATMDWSYSLLADQERILLRRLSVFVGGWTLEAAKAVCGGSPIDANNVLHLLACLVNKSLVNFEQHGGELRCRMLETIRQYAHERLGEAGEVEMLRGRHLDYFLKLAQEAEPKLHSSEQFIWRDILELERNNLHTALKFSQQEGQAERGIELAAALLEFWNLTGSEKEGREVVVHLLTHPEVAARNLIRANGLLVASIINLFLSGPDASRPYLEEVIDIARELGEPGKKLLALGLGYLGEIIFSNNPALAESMNEEAVALARSVGIPWVTAQSLHWKARNLRVRDPFAAQKSWEEALAIYQSIGNKRGVADIMGAIGSMLERQQDYTTARYYYEQSLFLAREINDRLILSIYMNSLGELERFEGKYDLAKKHYTDSLKISREIGAIPRVMMVLGNLGAVLIYQGDTDSAKSLITEELTLAQEFNNQPYVAYGLMGLAGVLAVKRKARESAQLLAVVQTYFASGDMREWSSADEKTYQHYLALMHTQIDETEFNAASAKGTRMTLDEAVRFALAQIS